jgi:hypothetical protein
MISPAQSAPLRMRHRVSSDDAWPLRGIDGKTFAERFAKKKKDQRK